MIMKILALLAVLVTIYLIFFKSSRKIEEPTKTSKKKSKPNTKELDGDTMIECAKCSTFISTKEAIIKSGKFYCSRECAEV